jgi:ribosomal-protein-alanine N-acetyltransferase
VSSVVCPPMPVAPAVIETPRLRGERIGPEHQAALAALHGDPRVGATLGGTQTPEQVAAGIARHVRNWDEQGFGYWLFRDRETGEPVGRGGLGRAHVAGRDEVEVGWAVMSQHWGRRYGTEIGAAALDVAFGPLGLTEVVAFTLPDNAASRRVMEKLGFSYEREIVWADLPHVLYRRYSPGSR